MINVLLARSVALCSPTIVSRCQVVPFRVHCAERGFDRGQRTAWCQ